MISQHISFQRIDTEESICVLETEWKDRTKEREMAVNELFCKRKIPTWYKKYSKRTKRWQGWKNCFFVRLISTGPDKKSENFQRSNVSRILSFRLIIKEDWLRILWSCDGAHEVRILLVKCFRLVLSWWSTPGKLPFFGGALRFVQKSVAKCHRFKSWAEKYLLFYTTKVSLRESVLKCFYCCLYRQMWPVW